MIITQIKTQEKVMKMYKILSITIIHQMVERVYFGHII